VAGLSHLAMRRFCASGASILRQCCRVEAFSTVDDSITVERDRKRDSLRESPAVHQRWRRNRAHAPAQSVRGGTSSNRHLDRPPTEWTGVPIRCHSERIGAASCDEAGSPCAIHRGLSRGGAPEQRRHVGIHRRRRSSRRRLRSTCIAIVERRGRSITNTRAYRHRVPPWVLPTRNSRPTGSQCSGIAATCCRCWSGANGPCSR
jgi:hypothetical protein